VSAPRATEAAPAAAHGDPRRPGPGPSRAGSISSRRGSIGPQRRQRRAGHQREGRVLGLRLRLLDPPGRGRRGRRAELGRGVRELRRVPDRGHCAPDRAGRGRSGQRDADQRRDRPQRGVSGLYDRRARLPVRGGPRRSRALHEGGPPAVGGDPSRVRETRTVWPLGRGADGPGGGAQGSGGRCARDRARSGARGRR